MLAAVAGAHIDYAGDGYCLVSGSTEQCLEEAALKRIAAAYERYVGLASNGDPGSARGRDGPFGEGDGTKPKVRVSRTRCRYRSGASDSWVQNYDGIDLLGAQGLSSKGMDTARETGSIIGDDDDGYSTGGCVVGRAVLNRWHGLGHSSDRITCTAMVPTDSGFEAQRVAMAPDLTKELGPVEDLLVVTGPNTQGRHGLQLAFRSATVIEASNEGSLDLGNARRLADLAAIEAPATDMNWTQRVIDVVRPALTGEASIVVIFPHDLAAEPTDRTVPDVSSSAADGAIPDLQVHSTGLVGDAVGVVLGPASSAADGLDARQFIAAVGRIVHLETLAGAAGSRSSRTLGIGEPPIAKRLRAEVHRLAKLLESETALRERAEERYRALLRSRLGRVTSRYWDLRKSFTGGPRR